MARGRPKKERVPYTKSQCIGFLKWGNITEFATARADLAIIDSKVSKQFEKMVTPDGLDNAIKYVENAWRM